MNSFNIVCIKFQEYCKRHHIQGKRIGVFSSLSVKKNCYLIKMLQKYNDYEF